MKFKNETDFRHDKPETLGVLLVNLGTPDAPTVRAVRRYLAEFLSDPRIVELPRWLWKGILHGVILRIRPRRSAAAYRSVWTDEGSPLLSHAQRQADALQAWLADVMPGRANVVLGMRYGNPSIAVGLERLRDANARRLLVLPLYPQYSATTTATTFDAVSRELTSWRWLPELRFITHYHDHPGYITALSDSILHHWQSQGEPDRLLFSFHGLPIDYCLKGDPYYCECQKTARLVAEQLRLPDDKWQVAFQSRVGNKEWLKPYTDEQLKAWGGQGVRKVHVICPGFSADCLETLEEIGVENRGYFLDAGGAEYSYIPALNDATGHIEALADLVRRHVAGWAEAEGNGLDETQLGERRERALAMGAGA